MNRRKESNSITSFCHEFIKGTKLQRRKLIEKKKNENEARKYSMKEEWEKRGLTKEKSKRK